MQRTTHSGPAGPRAATGAARADVPGREPCAGAAAPGLTDTEVRARRSADGPNVLPTPSRRPAWRQLVDQWTHFFALLLWVASGLALLAGMPQLAVAITVVVLINGLFAFVQEHRAERAAEHLQALLPLQVTVRRDGRRHTVEAAELVRDDVVLLTAGDRVSADLTLTIANALAVDTSTMTGESVPDHPSPGDELLAGTFVVEGEAEAIVARIGAATRLADIARLSQQPSGRRTPLAIELNRLVRIVAIIAVSVGVGFTAVSLLVGMPATDGFLFGVGVTVALVPEGLLPTVTLSLAIGAKRMASQNALVRRLEAVETLGSTTFICTDKTGTLTRNQMTAVAAWTPGGRVDIPGTAGYDPSDPLPDDLSFAALRTAAAVGRACSDGHVERRVDGWVAIGDPMEAAIDVLARRSGCEPPGDPGQRFPFDPRRRRMSVLRHGELAVKGAPDAVIPLCDDVPDAVVAAVEEFARAGWRTLAIARADVGDVAPVAVDATPAAVEQHLELLAVLAFEDPPRDGTTDALAACRRAGIKVAMVTGDHPATAAAIAREVGLTVGEAHVVTGAELPDDDELLAALVDRDGIVIARVSPEHKLRIAEALRRRGHVVAMTGDGVNDGPALHAADIGIAMGRSGTDVARESADLVLLDDEFATIVAAIEQGRATFKNIRRFLTYHLTDNVAELTPFVVWALSGGHFPLAIGVLQVLALDIGTDLLPALALGAEPPRLDALDGPPERGHLIDRHVLWRAFGAFGAAEAAVEMTAFVAVLVAAGWRPGDDTPAAAVIATASGAAFMAVVIGQIATALACRDRIGLRGNPFLIGAIAVELALLAFFLGFPPIAGLLDHAVPTLLGAAIAVSAFPLVLAVAGIVQAVTNGPARRPHAGRMIET